MTCREVVTSQKWRQVKVAEAVKERHSAPMTRTLTEERWVSEVVRWMDRVVCLVGWSVTKGREAWQDVARKRKKLTSSQTFHRPVCDCLEGEDDFDRGRLRGSRLSNPKTRTGSSLSGGWTEGRVPVAPDLSHQPS